MISIKPLANSAESLYYLELYVNDYKTIPGKKRALTRTIKDIQEQIEYLEPKINGARPCWYLGERWFNSDLLRLKAELDQAINYRNNLNNTK
jgi:hypothetical protein